MRPGVSWTAAGILMLTAASIRLFKQLPVRAQGTAVRTYVSSSECSSCHDDIAASYSKTAMAHSIYAAGKDEVSSKLRAEVVYYHAPSHTWFSIERRDGRLFQKRWQRDANARTINFDSEEVNYVIGSGDHVRTYLHRNENGTILELPLAWYAENGGTWALNPGFDNAAPPTRHTLSYGCIFCHDAYPQIPRDPGDSVAHPVIVGNLPEGIDCQRCHGPGSAHVQAARTPGVSSSILRSTILNPARLDNERQMEVCMQCHLEITSFHLPDHIQRFDRQPFSYTPDQPLASFLRYFQPDLKGKPDPRFGIDSAPYRLRQSQCFLRSGGALTCQSCHDPHEPHNSAANEQHYRAVCLSCHASRLETMISAAKHTREPDCIGCHMPTRRTDDVVHVAVTDHLIQRLAPPASVRLAPKNEIVETAANTYRGAVVPYPVGSITEADDDLYTATAQVMHDSNSGEGIPRLAKLIQTRHPAQPEFSIELGDALHRAGRQPEAISAYRDAVRTDPHSVRARRSLGAELAQNGQRDQAMTEFAAALADHPDEPLVWYEMGRLHSAEGKLSLAVRELTHATQLDPQLAEAYDELGIALAKAGNPVASEAAFRESLRISPYDSSVSRNLQMLIEAVSRRQP